MFVITLATIMYEIWFFREIYLRVRISLQSLLYLFFFKNEKNFRPQYILPYPMFFRRKVDILFLTIFSIIHWNCLGIHFKSLVCYWFMDITLLFCLRLTVCTPLSFHVILERYIKDLCLPRCLITDIMRWFEIFISINLIVYLLQSS